MAAISAVPALIDALVAQASTALPNVQVLDGMGITDQNPSDSLFIGVDDPATTGAATSADSQQSPSAMSPNRPRDEVGQITCAAFSWNGDGNQKSARDAAYATVEVVAAICRANPNLGLTAWSLLVTSFGTTVHLTQSQGDSGADALVIFQVSFKARI